MQTTSSHRDDLFQLLVDSVQDYAIFSLDRTGHVQSWNAGAQRIKGYTAQEVIGKHFSLFYPPAEVRRGKPEYVLRVAAEDGRYEEEGWRVRKDGTQFWASVVVTALHSPERELIGFAKVTRDLTERKQAEDDRNLLLALERSARAQAERSLEQLQAIQAITDEALAHLDLEELLRSLMDRVSEVLEVDTVAVLLVTEDGQALRPRAAKGLEAEVEANLRVPLGQGFAGRVAAERRPIVLEDVSHSEVLNPILLQKGVHSMLGVPLVVERRVIGVLHVGSLTDRHFTEENVRFLQVVGDRVAMAIDHARLYEQATRALQLAEAAGAELRLRDEFLSVAAHELRTPITGLRAASQLLLRQIGKGASVPTELLLRMVSVIEQESDKLSRLVNQLLDLSRLEGGKLALELSRLDVAELARSVVERVQVRAPDHRFQVLGESSLWLSADSLRLEQVLLNLLDNAVKFSPAGSEITVECKHSSRGRVQIAVRDHGIGLAEAECEPIFERFYQVDASERTMGLGLGLYISRQIADRHGGRLWAERPSDGGARFVLELSVAPGDPPADSQG